MCNVEHGATHVSGLPASPKPDLPAKIIPTKIA